VRYVCTWCDSHMWDDDTPPKEAVSYGICRVCVGGASASIDRVADLDPVSADGLAFGLIVLDREAKVVGYNQAEARLSGLPVESVLGKSFFNEVAPCTSVSDFRGRFEMLRDAGVTDSHHFEFLFRFKEGNKLVRVSMAYDAPSTMTTVLVGLA